MNRTLCFRYFLEMLVIFLNILLEYVCHNHDIRYTYVTMCAN